MNFDSIEMLCGDCLAILPTLDENSFDSCVTDPPYHLTSIVKRFGKNGSAPAQFGMDGAYSRASAGFMGKQWDGGDVAFRPETWAEVYRVLKPGAHLLAFGGTRTYHRMACAIEDAGFEIRDCIQWLYGSGFPKSHDVSKGIDKAAGVEFEASPASGVGFMGPDKPGGYNRTVNQLKRTGETTDAARQWEGWGTALKPACEPIVLARKPLSEKTVAANVLKWGTGAINVDGCRVEGVPPSVPQPEMRPHGNDSGHALGAGIGRNGQMSQASGRWPANVIHDGSDEVMAGFPESQGGAYPAKGIGFGYSGGERKQNDIRTEMADEGSAARFFYTAKADSDDRIGSKHPTVKPLNLIQYLVRLVTPKGGTVLDPFAGTGSTGEAAFRQGMNAILIEREAEYLKDCHRRLELLMAGPDERLRESVKASGKVESPGPLFDTAWNSV